MPLMSFGAMHDVLAAIAGLSILVGNLLALTQSNIKRMLGYSSIAHFGYLLIAVVSGLNIGAPTVAIYLATYVITALAAFGVMVQVSSPYQVLMPTTCNTIAVVLEASLSCFGDDGGDVVDGRHPNDSRIYRQVLCGDDRRGCKAVVAVGSTGVGQRAGFVLLPAFYDHYVPAGTGYAPF
jgi:hypothetical protein